MCHIYIVDYKIVVLTLGFGFKVTHDKGASNLFASVTPPMPARMFYTRRRTKRRVQTSPFVALTRAIQLPWRALILPWYLPFQCFGFAGKNGIFE